MDLAYDRAVAAVKARHGVNVLLFAAPPYGLLASAAALTPEWLLAHTDHLLLPTEARAGAGRRRARRRFLVCTLRGCAEYAK
jgi:hypothetical protein